MSDTSKIGLYSLDEVSWGVVPSIALDTMRYTSANFKPTLTTSESQEIVDDAQLRDLIQTGAAAEGEVGFELSYGSHDKWWSSLFRRAWPGSPASITGTTLSAASADNSFNDSGNGFVTAGFKAGQIIKVSGFSPDNANNGYHVISTVAAGKIVVTSSTTLVTDAAGDSVTIKGTPLWNGSTAISHTIEQKFVNEAGTNHFVSYSGMRVGSASLSLAPGSQANGSFSFMGKSAVSGSATVGTGAANAATTTDCMNAIGDVKLIHENSASIQVTKLDLAFDNALRTKTAVGTSAAVGIGQGQFKVSGSIQMYMEDRGLLDKVINQTASKLHIVIADTAGNAYGLSLPRIKYASADYPVSGNSQDLMITLPFTALRDTTLGYTAYLTRIPAA